MVTGQQETQNEGNIKTEKVSLILPALFLTTYTIEAYVCILNFRPTLPRPQLTRLCVSFFVSSIMLFV
jgi:hypothetical protein